MRWTPRTAATLIGTGRVAIGAVGWLVPGVLARRSGLRPAHDSGWPFMTRLFAARDLAIGVAQLTAADDRVDDWLTFGVPVDAADAVAALTAGARGHLPRSRALGMAALASSAVVMALAGRRG